MNCCIQLSVILVVAIFLPADAREISSEAKNKLKGDAAFSLVQTWSETVCYGMKHHSNDTKECWPAPKQWYIFDFNPIQPNGDDVDCKVGSPFTQEEIAPIKSELDSKWHPDTTDKDITDIRETHWKVSCAANIEKVNTPVKFYGKAIELFDKYNTDVLLQSAGILPGKKYLGETILSALTKVVGENNAEIFCFRHGDETYLLSTVIWFTNDFQSTSTSYNFSHFSECPKNAMIDYPATTPIHEKH